MTDGNQRSLEEGKRIARLLRQHFLNQEEIVATLMSWGKPHPVMGLDNLQGLLLGHVMGQESPVNAVARYETKQGALKVVSGPFRVGSYTPDNEGNTRWLCLDFDGEGHSDPLRDPEAAVRLTHAAFTDAGIPGHLEMSGGGKGWHLWVFFDEPTPAKLIRRLAHRLIPANLPLTDHRGVAIPHRNRGVEVFPKRDKPTTKTHPGNLVWLPFHHAAPAGANLFYREENGVLVPYVPEFFNTVTQETVECVLADLEARGVTKTARGPTAGSDRTTVDDAALEAFLRLADNEDATQTPPSTAWREWKLKALALLDLERIYGRWLTGESSGEGWLQCQDPESPSGSESKSGNVADGTGIALRGTYRSWRTEEGCSVFDFMVQHGLATSFIDAARQISEWTGVPLPSTLKPQAVGRNHLPVIVTNERQTRDVVTDARCVLEEANRRTPFLFQQDQRFLRIVESPKGAYAESISEQIAYGFLFRMADWVRRTDDGDAPVSPSHELSRDIVANPPGGLHPLEMIVTSPVFTASKKLLVEPGYDRDSGIWYWMSKGMDAMEVPETPGDEEVRAALSLLVDDLLVDFPFQSSADRAHALAALLLPFVKPMIRGLCPIHLVEAPAIGSGKTLVAKLAHIIATGRSAPITTMGRDDEETRKKITSLLATGARIVIIDNVVAGISSANLAAAITSDVWKDRWLGTHDMPELPNNAIWFFTGNNPDLSLEMARRCIRIRIESPDERPWLRKDFKHDPIEDWALEHRSEIVQAILVLIQSWVSSGAVLADVTMGSFQQWAQTMGGILEHLDVPGFLDNRDEMYEVADAKEMEWWSFVQTWWDEYGGVPVATSELRTLAQQNDMLVSSRGTKSDASQSIRLGKDLRSLRGRRFGDLKIVQGRALRDKANRWSLVQVSDGDDGPHDGPPNGSEGIPRQELKVTDIFSARRDRAGQVSEAESTARRVDDQARRVETPTLRASNPFETNDSRRVAESADSHPGVWSRASAETRTHDAQCARNARGVPDNPPHSPRLSAEETISTSYRAEGCRDIGHHSPRSDPQPSALDDSNVDLADIDQLPDPAEEEE